MSDALDSLPEQIALSRVLDLKASAEFLSVSLPTLRRMYRSGTLPRPIPLNERTLGYQVCTLKSWADERSRLSALSVAA
jgi:predicted DNA-binding transcriptional regulator AlpA